MDLEDLTLGQAKQLIALFNGEKQSTILSEAIGKYCIVRTRNEGINAGMVVMADETGVVLEEARRIYYHKPKSTTLSWYEGVSQSGLSKDSKISGTVERKYIIEDYSLTICSLEAQKSIRNHEAQKS